MRVIECGGDEAPCPAHGSLRSLDLTDVAKDRPDAHLLAIGKGGQVEARCSLWWQNVPHRAQGAIGLIGHYSATTDTAAHALLANAQQFLCDCGCTRAVGPMNGSTWRGYRFVTEPGNAPAFFLEPQNPPEWPRQFVSAGFSSLASYCSSVNCDLLCPDPRADAVETRLRNAGVTIRAAAPEMRRELEGIYAVSRIAFRKNLLYAEIPFTEFASLYEPILPAVCPELVWIAERGGECVGYLFAIPDLAQAARGLQVDTFVIKTVAILPQPELRGLGTSLAMRAHRRGHELGFRRCIHALMCSSNVSLNISRRYAQPMRRYALYSRELAR